MSTVNRESNALSRTANASWLPLASLAALCLPCLMGRSAPNLREAAAVLCLARAAPLCGRCARRATGLRSANGSAASRRRGFLRCLGGWLLLEERGQCTSCTLYFRSVAASAVNDKVTNVSKLLKELLSALFYSCHHKPRID